MRDRTKEFIRKLKAKLSELCEESEEFKEEKADLFEKIKMQNEQNWSVDSYYQNLEEELDEMVLDAQNQS
jgi:chromosome segregation ATPase